MTVRKVMAKPAPIIHSVIWPGAERDDLAAATAKRRIPSRSLPKLGDRLLSGSSKRPDPSGPFMLDLAGQGHPACRIARLPPGWMASAISSQVPQIES